MTDPRRTTTWTAFCLPLAAAMIWAVNMVVTKMSVSVISPSSIAFYRWVLAAVLLTPFVARGVWRARRAIAAQFWRLAVLGGLGMALYQGMAYVAARSTTATNLGIITSLVPAMTIGVNVVLTRTLPRATAVVGGLLSLFGLAVLLGHGDPRNLLEIGIGTGDGLMMIASLAYALYTVLIRKWAMPIDPWHSLYVQILIGVLLQLPTFLATEPSPLTARNVPLVLYAALLPSLLAPYMWMESLRRLGADRTSLFLNLVPIGTALIAAALLGEQLHLYHLTGGGVAIAGVALAQWNGRAFRRVR
ncbi:DMT family transporter [Chitinasiproducens palmae]|uniref:Permease of the drug/metabolite transporter (DMT) superfamily n=1 Tax=Chitinasiproducens palmae TaxID=1770053 RepID=A0A1H2PUF2_9BURK|nr:DMT family transporter [Chitinasiproducens palmae]SDV50422.1 Permease of the drug/metabolite transporter (DMT) superfamily [Chitinasiproducens palmae]